MKRSQSSNPISLPKCNRSLVRQRSFLNNQEASRQISSHKSELNEAKLEKVLLEAEESYNRGEYEAALMKFSKGASLRPKNEAFALGVRKSRIAILNDLKDSGDSPRIYKDVGELVPNFLNNPMYSNTQKTSVRKSMQPKITSRSENNDKTEFKSDTARSIYTNCKKLNSEQIFNLKIYDGKIYKVIPASMQDVNEYLHDKDYFKMKQHNAKEWKKLRSEMNKKIAEKEAIERYEKETKLLEEKNNIRHFCEEQVTLIGRYYQNNKISDVIRFSENFIKYLNKKADRLLPRKWIYLSTAFNYLGRAYVEKGDFEKAKAFGEKLYKVAISSANTELISQSYILSGKIYVKFRKFEEAAFVWEKLIPIIEDSEKKAWLFHEIGRCYFEMEKYDSGYKYGTDSVLWAEKCLSSKWISAAKVLQAQCEMKRGNYKNAFQLFVEAKKHAEMINDEKILNYIASIEDLLNTALTKPTANSNSDDF